MMISWCINGFRDPFRGYRQKTGIHMEPLFLQRKPAISVSGYILSEKIAELWIKPKEPFSESRF